MERPRCVLVTGASSGFGAATARVLSERGFHVFGTSRSINAPPPHPDVMMVQLDVHDEDSVNRCITEVLERHPVLHGLVNNAGRAMVGACEETSAHEAQQLFETNLFGLMRMTSAVLPQMRAQGGGTIVNMGSLSGIVAPPFHGVYAATKHAVAGYTQALHHEVRHEGIRVVLVEPDAHRTGISMQHPAHPIATYDDGRQRVEGIIQSQIEGGRPPEVVAHAIRRALEGHGPWRMRVGSKARLASWLGALPTWLVDWALRREFALP